MSRQASAECEIEVTPEMIEAGVYYEESIGFEKDDIVIRLVGGRWQVLVVREVYSPL